MFSKFSGGHTCLLNYTAHYTHFVPKMSLLMLLSKYCDNSRLPPYLGKQYWLRNLNDGFRPVFSCSFMAYIYLGLFWKLKNHFLGTPPAVPTAKNTLTIRRLSVCPMLSVVCCSKFNSVFLGQMKSDWADFWICYSSNKTWHKIKSYQKSAQGFGGTVGQK